MNDQENDLYQMTLKWLTDDKPNNEQIAERFVDLSKVTYELTKKQMTDSLFKILFGQDTK